MLAVCAAWTSESVSVRCPQWVITLPCLLYLPTSTHSYDSHHLLLAAQGQTIVSPSDRALLHPLAIPLAKGPAPTSQTANAALRGPETYTCLLQYRVGGEGSSGGRLPIVQMSSEALAVSLLARNTDEYLHRCMAHAPDAWHWRAAARWEKSGEPWQAPEGAAAKFPLPCSVAKHK